MQVSGYSDLLAFTRRNRVTSQLREQLQTVSQEAVTGLKADITKATDGRTGEAHLLQKAINDLDLSRQMNSLSQTRLSLTQNSVEGVRNAVNDIGTRASVALNSNAQIGIDIIIDEAGSNLESVMSAINARQGARHLLSGAATDRPPFGDGAAQQVISDITNILSNAPSVQDAEADLDTYFNDAAGGFATNIYQGSTNNTSGSPIGNGSSVQLGLRGDNEGFRDMIRGLGVLASSKAISENTEPNAFKTIFASGASFAAQGNDAMIKIEGQIGIVAETLAKGEERLKNEAVALGEAFNSVFGRDQFEAAAELKSLQVQLEASYAITARLSDLTLTNYLR
jgi:flagellar hook-associated protein 3 FlgL